MDDSAEIDELEDRIADLEEELDDAKRIISEFQEMFFRVEEAVNAVSKGARSY